MVILSMWECSEIKTFWVKVKNLIKKIILKQITLDSKLFIIALFLDEHKFGKAETN